MPLNRTEILRVALRGETIGSLVLIPATPNRPWLLSQQDVTIATVALPPEASFTAIFRELQTQAAGLVRTGWRRPTTLMRPAIAPGAARTARPMT